MSKRHAFRVPATSSRCVCAKFCFRSTRLCRHVFIVLLWTCALFRIGEAANPGPRTNAVDVAFTLGVCNPSGLGGKAPTVHHQMGHGDLWSVAAHLSSRAMSQFKAGLAFERSSLKYVVGGHPAPARAHSQVAGGYKGVAVISKHPTRSVPTCWPESIQRSSRAMVSASYIHDQWIVAGTMYGEPESGMYPRAKFHNEALLNALVTQVCSLSSGPRYIAGDLNSELDSLPSFTLLEQAGFCDIQTIAQHRWGCTPQFTCKGRTRKDFLFLSPELQAQLVGVHVIHDIWPDHAVLQGVFRRCVRIVPQTIWIPPKEFPWPPDFHTEVNFWPTSDEPMDVKYEQAWMAIESAAAKQCPLPVPKSCFGRGRSSYTKVKRQQHRSVPLKPSRQGDITPLFAGQSWKYSCWFRQARRLQHYVRHASKSVDAHQSPHAEHLWNSVVHAQGFDSGFVQWWKTCGFRAPNAPALCPFSPPVADVATGISSSVLMAVRDFEKEMRSNCSQYARMRRQQNPMLIFRDLKDDPPCTSEVFVTTRSTKVTLLDPTDLCLVTSEVVDWDLDKPIYCGGHTLEVIHCDHDSLWLSSLPDVPIGTLVTQSQYVGDTEQVLEAFSSTWEKRWTRHADIPLSQWNQILDFARSHLPRRSFTWPSMTAEDLRTTIRLKKTRTSKGLDGVTIADLRALHPSVLDTFCQMFLEAECSSCWPQQLIDGRITAIPKHACPGGPDDFRPITILGLLYRTWGSFHSKKALAAIDSLLPEGLHGSRPGCYAGQLWGRILWALEHAHTNQFHLCGLVVDIVKAFNFLPRSVTAEVLALLGIPFKVLRAWHGALAKMHRRFQVRNALGREISGYTGYPEGDALSVLAMVGINCIFHSWMQYQAPACVALSYVDDWQIITNNPEAMDAMVRKLDALLGHLDLTLDAKKSYCWATSGEARKTLQSMPFATKLSAKSLGAHIQLCKRHTNWTLTERIAAMQPLWTKLQYSPSAYYLKTRAIRMAAWPRGLHGVAATSLSVQAFQDLRRAAMKSLGTTGAGVNAWVHLGLIEQPFTDPLFWTIFTTMQTARMTAPFDAVRQHLAAWASGTFQGPKNGVTTTLANRITRLGWRITTAGLIHDAIGQFDFLQIGKAELCFRMQLAWPGVVAEVLQHRPGFGGLAHADVTHTRHWLNSLCLASQGAMKKVLNGAHITQDGIAHCQRDRTGVTNQCLRCGSSDGRFHRFWICEYYQHHREGLPADFLALVPSLPESLASYGWSLSPHTRIAWLKCLHAISEPPLPDLVDPAPDQEWLRIFTDGACEDPRQPYVRFAGWGVILATLHFGCPSAAEIDSGWLPGVLQSSYRAEVFAVLRALQIALKLGRRAHIWTDCNSVLSQLTSILLGRNVPTSVPHGDLWTRIAGLVRTLGVQAMRATKVASHVDEAEQMTPLDLWSTHWNGHADTAAGNANLERPAAFWSLLERHRLATRAAHEISRHVQRVQLDVSLQVLREADVGTGDPPVALEPPSAPAPTPVWVRLPALHALPSGAIRWYGDFLVRQILSWFWQAVGGPCEEEVKWVSHFQLYVDYQLCTGHFGPVHRARWLNPDEHTLLGLENIPFKTRTRWFCKVLKECLRHMSIQLAYATVRPNCRYLNMHSSCIALPWPRPRIDCIDHWLRCHLTSAAAREGRILEALPLATRSEDMPRVILTDVGVI